MRIEETPLAGAYLITPEPVEDERGAFARLFCAETFAARGLATQFEQSSFSYNRKAGTLRGLHLQRPPHAEVKLIRATAGAVFDVIVDLRAGSPTYGRWHGAELSAENRRQFYVPAGFAHGFQSLKDHSELTYAITPPYAPAFQDGVGFDDPELAIAWPDATGAIASARDRALPPLSAFAPIAL
ncbi:MAG TPA: dTDP-4-dehydrorhamnose 3,5-epimerase [Caulobacteraceae bacterium]|jgi:dTDP-4-dehydrorhamnose 3,5-epimerase